jgi:hypothetical protein
LKVRDAVNGHVGRERLTVNRITVCSGEQEGKAVLVWNDTEAPVGDELKCLWELDVDEDKLVELILAGASTTE